ncbi:hypothetical protein B0T25DRAFT_617998 [Lasiosphaeria hispida]|uniref:Extracellular serine-rich protein n=1 Tax=Lasiosphaeria hispida TaxID=260671 RepID=A0AAJ0M9A0_9PEZI|nr:hypothetical protein B0T25DRAFT_617998 [Lasiosphaeria hispida]
MVGLTKWLCALSVCAISAVSAFVNGDVKDTVLVFARTQDDADQVTSGLQAYGIPYESVIVPSTGVALPTLKSSSTSGNYGGFITVSELSYDLGGGTWGSALTDVQWNEVYSYQDDFGVRLVRIEGWPQLAFGVDLANPSVGGTSDDNPIKLVNSSTFPTARLKLNQAVSTKNLWHIPAVVTDPSTTVAFANFDAGGSFTTETVAGVINTSGTRKQMVWFMSWNTDWAYGPNFLQHASIHFLTRGLFVGARKTHLSLQVDDVLLSTEIYNTSPVENFRIATSDLNNHVTWQTSLNGRLPSGSNFFIELAHNGAGDLEVAGATAGPGVCVPDTYVLGPDYPSTTPVEFKKTLGTGIDYWDPSYVTYSWSATCAKLDPLANWFTSATNRNHFAHVSHTFTHLYLNNATYSDAAKEIQFNQAWATQIGISSANKWSPHGLVPPSISGLHNGDVIKAWLDNGIQYAVGDNTRPVLRNPDSEYWPRVTTVEDDGYAGLTVIPRWATNIYYNCYTSACTVDEWADMSGSSKTYADLIDDARTTNVKHLLGFHADPFMFHQANLRVSGQPSITVGSQTGTFSLLQIWAETVTQEFYRLTDWPLVSQKHDDIAATFIDRKTRDLCQPRLKYTITSSGTITGGTVSSNGNTCTVPLPVTVPSAVTFSGSGVTSDQVGNEPLIKWVMLSGSARAFTFNTPVPL